MHKLATLALAAALIASPAVADAPMGNLPYGPDSDAYHIAVLIVARDVCHITLQPPLDRANELIQQRLADQRMRELVGKAGTLLASQVSKSVAHEVAQGVPYDIALKSFCDALGSGINGESK
ncbi:hypothetical protein V5F32_06115 [Xanthobacter oligotrophicus]|uniref:Uncharacterized protein n=1 Tax=Xanthobacter oligotrophicus TaxID=2607286 RepID=A0ABW6ZSN0_9HYPH